MFLCVCSSTGMHLSWQANNLLEKITRSFVNFWAIFVGHNAIGHMWTNTYTTPNAMLIPYVYHYWVFGQIQCSFTEILIEKPAPVLPWHGVETTRWIHFEATTMVTRHQLGILGAANILQDTSDYARAIVAPIVAVKTVAKFTANRRLN